MQFLENSPDAKLSEGHGFSHVICNGCERRLQPLRENPALPASLKLASAAEAALVASVDGMAEAMPLRKR